jgi:hypothetical protein
VAQVVTHRGQLRPPRQSMCGVRMSHPVWTCPAQLFGSLWRFGLNDVGSCREKSLPDVPQPGRSDTVLTAPCLQVSNERGRRLPHGWCGWYTALHQEVLQRHPGQRGQGHFASVAALADQLKPMVCLGIRFNLPQGGPTNSLDLKPVA